MKETGVYRKSKASLSRPGNIVLVGLSGAGKTSIGRDLAWQLGFGFFDLDEAIESLKKKKLPRFSLKREQVPSVPWKPRQSVA